MTDFVLQGHKCLYCTFDHFKVSLQKKQKQKKTSIAFKKNTDTDFWTVYINL